MPPSITLSGTVAGVGRYGDDHHEVVLDMGSAGRVAFRVTEADARAFARHLYETVRVTVECVESAGGTQQSDRMAAAGASLRWEDAVLAGTEPGAE